MAAQKYFFKLSYLELGQEKKATRITNVDFSTITDYSTLLDYLDTNFVLNFNYDSLYDIVIEDIQLIQGSNSGSGLIAQIITCTEYDELQSNNLIGAALWMFIKDNIITAINAPGISFNATTGTVTDTNGAGFFSPGVSMVVLYNY